MNSMASFSWRAFSRALEELGAAFFIPTAVVPPLLVTHFLIFQLLVRPK
jgi:hypothetical protein